MKNKEFEKKLLRYCLVLFLITLISTSILVLLPVVSLGGLNIYVVAGKSSYYMRENVDIYANLTLNETPVNDSLIGIEIDNPNGSVIYRTLNTSNYNKIEDLKISNLTPGIILVSQPFEPQNIFKIDEPPYPDFEVTLQNDGVATTEALVTICVYDASNTLLFSSWTKTTIAAGGTTKPTFSMGAGILNWTTIGEAKVYVNAFASRKFPKEGGYPLCKEKSCSFIITNRKGDEIEPSGNPLFNPSRIESTYALTSRLEPSPVIGNYAIYATAVYQFLPASNSAQFLVDSGNYPPRAEFTWSPLEPYNNQNVEFDASGSTSSEGTIITYEWDFGDGSPKKLEDDPIITHAYTTGKTYPVTLNVTDSSEQWAVSIRSIKVLPPSPPQASFVITSNYNLTVNFNSTSKPGWNGTGFSPIVSYRWAFGDGNITTVPNPTIVHTYSDSGNYTVTLTVTDAMSRSNATSQLVTVTMVIGLEGDLNNDGVVNIFDIVIIAVAYGSHTGDPNWDPVADIDQNGVINVFDVVVVALNFGKHL